MTAAGLCGFGLGTWTAIEAIDRMGATVAVPIHQGARPLLAVVVAVSFLGETIDTAHVLGIGSILVGDWFLTSFDAQGEPLKALRQAAVIFPLMAGLAFAAQDILISLAVQRIDHPLLGATIGVGSAFVMWSLVTLARASRRTRLKFGHASWWGITGGVCVGLALICLVSALDRSDVSVVAPITATQPLIVFLLSFLLLRDLERLTPRNALSALVIVAGSALIVG